MHGTIDQVSRRKQRWTEGRSQRLKDLWDDPRNYSAAEVSQILSTEFHAAISRSAVLSKVARLDLVGRKQWGINRGGRNRTGKATHEVLPREPHPDSSKCLGAPVSLLGLNEATCRWPVGDPQKPDFAFCGAKPMRKFVYCECHCGVAYPQMGGFQIS